MKFKMIHENYNVSDLERFAFASKMKRRVIYIKWKDANEQNN